MRRYLTDLFLDYEEDLDNANLATGFLLAFVTTYFAMAASHEFQLTTPGIAVGLIVAVAWLALFLWLPPDHSIWRERLQPHHKTILMVIAIAATAMSILGLYRLWTYYELFFLDPDEGGHAGLYAEMMTGAKTLPKPDDGLHWPLVPLWFLPVGAVILATSLRGIFLSCMHRLAAMELADQ